MVSSSSQRLEGCRRSAEIAISSTPRLTGPPLVLPRGPTPAGSEPFTPPPYRTVPRHRVIFRLSRIGMSGRRPPNLSRLRVSKSTRRVSVCGVSTRRLRGAFKRRARSTPARVPSHSRSLLSESRRRPEDRGAETASAIASRIRGGASRKHAWQLRVLPSRETDRSTVRLARKRTLRMDDPRARSRVRIGMSGAVSDTRPT